MVLIITLMGIFAMAARFSVGSDTWWHLAAGRLILEKGQILKTDPFSYTRAGAAWEYPGWLAEIGMFWIYHLFGPGGLNVLTASIVTLVFGLVWISLQGNVYFRSFLLILAAAASGVYWAARPYMITFLFSALFLTVLEREWCWWRSTPRDGESPEATGKIPKVWLLPPLMILWVNSHGGFAVGFILYGIYFLGILSKTGLIRDYWELLRSSELGWKQKGGFLWGNRHLSSKHFDLPRNLRVRWRNFLIAGILITLAVSINPFGPKMLLYPLKTVRIEALGRFIEEWQPPNFHERRILPFLMLMVMTFGFVGASRKPISVKNFFLAAGFGVLALTAARNIALFALVSPVVISDSGVNVFKSLREDAGWLQDTNGDPSRFKEVINFLLLALGAAAVIYKAALIYPQSRNEEYFRSVFPVEAVDYLEQEQPQGRLFNSYNWGGYLIWELPEKPVFVDGRTDLYGDKIVGQWVEVVRGGENWQEIIREWDVDIILLEPDRPVVRLLAESGWEVEYQGDQAVIFTK